MEEFRGSYFFILVISIIFVSTNYAFADNETSNEHGNVKTTEKIYYKDTFNVAFIEFSSDCSFTTNHIA